MSVDCVLGEFPHTYGAALTGLFCHCKTLHNNHAYGCCLLIWSLSRQHARVPTCGSAHSRWRHRPTSRPCHWNMSLYFNQSHYPDMELTTSRPILLKSGARLGKDKCQVCASVTWLGQESNSRPSHAGSLRSTDSAPSSCGMWSLGCCLLLSYSWTPLLWHYVKLPLHYSSTLSFAGSSVRNKSTTQHAKFQLQLIHSLVLFLPSQYALFHSLSAENHSPPNEQTW